MASDFRAAAFINHADLLKLEDHEVHAVLDDLLDIPPANHERMLALHEFAQDLFQSDDDYDDFRREVSGLLAGDDACADCELDPDDCECDEDEEPAWDGSFTRRSGETPGQFTRRYLGESRDV